MAHVIALDYNNINAIISTLESNKVHTVISTIITLNGNRPMISLIKAAKKLATTKRYIPSF